MQARQWKNEVACFLTEMTKVVNRNYCIIILLYYCFIVLLYYCWMGELG